MRKICFVISIILIFLFTGCSVGEDSMENITIYTTTYPLNYLIDYLYGDNAKIYSIYPTGVIIDDYELSDRKLEEYSEGDLFVFNSQDKDRDYAVSMINLNSNLKVIDSALGMSYDYSTEELWLNPYSYLMMAENIKDGLIEYITDPYLISNDDGTGIEDKYEELEYDISKLDSELTEAISNGEYKTIVVDNDLFKYLEKYGLTVISLEENDSLSTNTINEVKKLIESGNIKYIYSTSDESNDTVIDLVKEYDVEILAFNTMRSVDGGITNTNDNYLTIMNNNINLLKQELYK